MDQAMDTLELDVSTLLLYLLIKQLIELIQWLAELCCLCRHLTLLFIFRKIFIIGRYINNSINKQFDKNLGNRLIKIIDRKFNKSLNKNFDKFDVNSDKVLSENFDKLDNSSDKVLCENLITVYLSICPDIKSIIRIYRLKNYFLRKLFLKVYHFKICPLKFQKVSYIINFCLRTMDINITLFKKCYAITKNVMLLQKMICHSKNIMLLLYIIYTNIYENSMVELYHMLKYYIQCFWYNKLSLKNLSYKNLPAKIYILIICLLTNYVIKIHIFKVYFATNPKICFNKYYLKTLVVNKHIFFKFYLVRVKNIILFAKSHVKFTKVRINNKIWLKNSHKITFIFVLNFYHYNIHVKLFLPILKFPINFIH